jgi:hypothetical protein
LTIRNALNNSVSPVIDETTSQSTKPASWQVAGYPAQAGIQLKETAREADSALILPRYAGIFQSTGFPPARE